MFSYNCLIGDQLIDLNVFYLIIAKVKTFVLASRIHLNLPARHAKIEVKSLFAVWNIAGHFKGGPFTRTDALSQAICKKC